MKKFGILSTLLVAASILIAWKEYRVKPYYYCNLSGTIFYTTASGTDSLEVDSITYACNRFANTWIYFRRKKDLGEQGHYTPGFDSVKTDVNGNFKIRLRVGNYELFEKWKKYPLVIPKDGDGYVWNKSCYTERHQTPDAKFKLNSSTSSMNFLIKMYTPQNDPCCKYTPPIIEAPAPPTNRSGNQPGHQE